MVSRSVFKENREYLLLFLFIIRIVVGINRLCCRNLRLDFEVRLNYRELAGWLYVIEVTDLIWWRGGVFERGDFFLGSLDMLGRDDFE